MFNIVLLSLGRWFSNSKNMSRKSELLKGLIDEWEVYTENDMNLSMSDFAEWLHGRNTKRGKDSLPDEVEKEIEDVSLNNTVARFCGKLIQYSNVWAKLTFRETAFRGFEDYGIAQTILHSKEPTKSNVTGCFLMEKSTAFEIIRRMQKLGLVEESPGKKDKRTKQVKVTKKGIAELKKANLKVNKYSNLILGNLTEKKKIEFLKLLLHLNDFHGKEYEKGLKVVEEKWF